jgi:membrane protein required for colicin V production
MNGADYLILGVLAFSILLGMFRGFVSESIALLAWLGGLWLAWRYAQLLEPYLGGMLSEPPVRTWAARTLIVMMVVIIGWIVAGLLGYLLRHSGLSISVDRWLGMLFGAVRGVVVVAAFVLLAQFARMDQAPWWQKSRLLPYATECAAWIHAFAETGMTMLEEQARSSTYSAIAASPRA